MIRTMINIAVMMALITIHLPGWLELQPGIQTQLSLILSAVLLINEVVHLVMQMNSRKHLQAAVTVPSVNEREDDRVPHLPDLEGVENLPELVERVIQAYASSGQGQWDGKLENVRDSMDVYRQSYQWVKKMQDLYGKTWNEYFQQTDLPFTPEQKSERRRLILEIAMHTVDFCRYRTGYINLTSPMTVNPRMILLDEDAEQAGAKGFIDRPDGAPREVIALKSLADEDNFTLKNATFHGFEVRK